jgi:hypothetical protein
MLVDNIKTMEGRLKDSRSEAETKLLKDSIKKAKAQLAREDKAAKSKSSGATQGSRATAANVRKLDREAKAADKRADEADRKFQAEYKKARKVDQKAGQARAALTKDPQNQAKKDAYRVASMEARNAMDRARILQKQARKLDREAKALDKAATKLDKEYQKSIKKK